MFGKTTNTPARRSTDAPAPADASTRRPAQAASLLAHGLRFEGQLSGDGEIHIEGEVRGDIHVARVVVCESAHVTGVIKGEHVTVRGRVEGAIEAETVKLHETARVDGDIVYGQLSIDVGARFEGRCRQAEAKPSAEVIELETAVG
jgi:cytoskeletal protein CcmA (bactofilin family)